MNTAREQERDAAAALISAQREARARVVEALKPTHEADAIVSNLRHELYRLGVEDEDFAMECLQALSGYIDRRRRSDYATVMDMYDEAVRGLELRHYALREANRALVRLHPALVEMRETVDRAWAEEMRRRRLGMTPLLIERSRGAWAGVLVQRDS